YFAEASRQAKHTTAHTIRPMPVSRWRRSRASGRRSGAFSGKVGTGFPQKMRPKKDLLDQYVARPPEMSNTAPVVNEHSAEAQNAASAAISSTSTKRPRGIFASM